MGNLSGVVETLIFFCVFFGVCFGLAMWGCWALIDAVWIDDAIRTTTPIVPEIELVIKDNLVDTVYIYRQPK